MAAPPRKRQVPPVGREVLCRRSHRAPSRCCGVRRRSAAALHTRPGGVAEAAARRGHRRARAASGGAPQSMGRGPEAAGQTPCVQPACPPPLRCPPARRAAPGRARPCCLKHAELADLKTSVWAGQRCARLLEAPGALHPLRLQAARLSRQQPLLRLQRQADGVQRSHSADLSHGGCAKLGSAHLPRRAPGAALPPKPTVAGCRRAAPRARREWWGQPSATGLRSAHGRLAGQLVRQF